MDMAHWRKMFDGKFIGAWDLVDNQDRPVDKTFTIEAVEKQKIKSKNGEDGKPVIRFKGIPKPWIANVTCCKTISMLYGDDTDDWVGKRITVYATTTTSPEGEVPCIRVRPKVPPPINGKREPEPPPPVDMPLPREPGAEG